MRTITANTELLTTDDSLMVISSADVYIQLPKASGSGLQSVISNRGSGTVYICPNVGETINFAASYSLGQYDTIQIIDSYATSWTMQLFNDYNTYSALSVKTVKKTIGNVGVTADFNFVSAANKTEQPIDLGAIVPAKARVIDVFTYTDAAFTNLGALGVKIGNATGGEQFAASANVTAIDTINQVVAAGSFAADINKAASKVWISATPGNNWNSATPVGKLTVYVSYIDVTNI